MAHIFDGKEFAKQKKQRLEERVAALKKSGITPRLVTFILTDDPASVMYVDMKKKALEGIGGEVFIFKANRLGGTKAYIDKVIRFNRDRNYHGVMFQLPLPRALNFPQKREKILNAISPEKDVDGHLKNGPFMSATVKAIMDILKEAGALERKDARFVVVGSKGTVGGGIFRALSKAGYHVHGYDRSGKQSGMKDGVAGADIVISTTGKPGIIKGEYIKNDAIVIDTGSPKGDVEKGVYKKASFVTPVPGGVGPVTIACLLENLVTAAEKQTL